MPHFSLIESKTPSIAYLYEELKEEIHSETESKGLDLLKTVRNYVAHPLRATNSTAEVKEKHLECLDTDPVGLMYLHDLSQYYLESLFLKFCNFGIREYGLLEFRPLIEELNTP